METGNEIFDETFDETYKIKKDGNWDIVRKHDLGRHYSINKISAIGYLDHLGVYIHLSQ